MDRRHFDLAFRKECTFLLLDCLSVWAALEVVTWTGFRGRRLLEAAHPRSRVKPLDLLSRLGQVNPCHHLAQLTTLQPGS